MDMRTEVTKAIETILAGGQSYRIGERQLTRADLGQLMKLRRELESEAGYLDGDPRAIPNASVAVFDRR